MKVSQFSNKGLTGVISEYHPNGTLAIEKFLKNQLPYGTWRYFSKKGILTKIEPFELGKHNGVIIEFKDSDTLSTQTYVNGIKSGQWHTFYENGNAKTWATYKFNNLEGAFTHFHENGKKSYTGNFYRGRRVGQWTYYSTKEKAILIETYKNGELISKEVLNHS